MSYCVIQGKLLSIIYFPRHSQISMCARRQCRPGREVSFHCCCSSRKIWLCCLSIFRHMIRRKKIVTTFTFVATSLSQKLSMHLDYSPRSVSCCPIHLYLFSRHPIRHWKIDVSEERLEVHQTQLQFLSGRPMQLCTGLDVQYR